jgi:hypothetical protein
MQRYGQGADDTLPLENNGDYTREVGFIKFSDFTSNISAADSVTVDNHLNNLWYQPEEIFPVDGIPEQRQHALWVPVDSKYYIIAKKLEVFHYCQQQKYNISYIVVVLYSDSDTIICYNNIMHLNTKFNNDK